jgi:hypothetical protein
VVNLLFLSSLVFEIAIFILSLMYEEMYITYHVLSINYDPTSMIRHVRGTRALLRVTWMYGTGH